MKIDNNRYRSKYEEDVCSKLHKSKVPFEYETINLYYEISACLVGSEMCIRDRFMDDSFIQKILAIIFTCAYFFLSYTMFKFLSLIHI